LVRRLPADHELDREIRQTEQTLQQLKAQKALLEIRMEEDGDAITIYGVGEPIARHRSDRLRWLKANGAAKLRQLCSKLERARRPEHFSHNPLATILFRVAEHCGCDVYRADR